MPGDAYRGLARVLRGGVMMGGLVVLMQTALAGDTIAPCKVGRMNGTPILVVDGEPFVVLGAQCDVWRGTRQDAKTEAFFDGFQQMNATTVGADVPWAKIETSEDHYDFAFIDWFIREAEAHNLKLILHLFDSNICGKIGGAGEPPYTPAYIVNAPGSYQRMELNEKAPYAGGGPPMCPNDPRTLERERLLVTKIAQHLKDTDLRRTVILLQIDNEFYYQQWRKEKPANLKAVRCHCPWCEKKFDSALYISGQDFMFHSFADYARVLSDAIAAVYDVPLYLNDPWWPPAAVPIFLDRCPHISFVGMDGMTTPNEPNHLTAALVGRNLAFAAESPTENAKTRANLDVLPYYMVVGREGIGDLLWECHPPLTVVDDPAARARYGAALYPLKNAMAPMLRVRGTERFAGWYAIRRFNKDTPKDERGNFALAPGTKALVSESYFVREGTKTREVAGGDFAVHLGEMTMTASRTAAGVVFEQAPGEFILASASGRFGFGKVGTMKAEAGRFVGDKWVMEREVRVERDGTGAFLELKEPGVVRVVVGPG